MSHIGIPSPKILALSLFCTGKPYIEISKFVCSQKSLNDYLQLCGFKLLFIEDGKGWQFFGHRKIYVKQGDLFLIPPGEIYRMDGLENTKSWIVVFEADPLNLNSIDEDLLLLSFLQPKSNYILHIHVVPKKSSRLIIRLHELKDELCSKRQGFERSVDALLSLLLIDALRISDSRLKKISFQSKQLLKKVFQFIEANYSNHVGLLDVAKEVNLSPGYLTELVRLNTGKAVFSWIIERRMAEARHLLFITNRPVYQIAEGLGYLYVSHFIRQFRQYHGITPQAWRHRHVN
ncbi:AraC family transcriptional regulator [Mastigocoleus testarum]|uniref:HTH araC/xylS-type domain-containing protein n=1 Tax=Mastigocoleus testarum BC008 TaxID=371196 RepID=A0A0V7ZWQ6_9CYAN|nr:AraC family transcriptional regulator [Mastigocoleus testarum]KST68515.1 hypothetical protein BC008_01210 [Mastigocoleus testarum BC008]KST68662.1 hypothetical protein BC008_01515 [Mastigocoleus testarum BC008]